ncbi:diguanylate cyclase [Candidatus Desantisbacteria bacterium CG_4_10_14_0_8_um_filter_48_22]|uniref:Diguanylate cyclase n=1 Tax=Candidatus Desantisbacteria bacterium CG_4_10_14_0_8_um_filter_48_22 TaxID=1974543 RepID=A0A2M7SES5_9BACT|nr:MAG: diguanylate cyclase [Candidatus Desantisbacteria bacterium CG1_02_49_89]PIV57211.1 MAG: diguanylate cyclase [Candidatus Desantisbacteria bacterium CG02_land_8_20_14_3_00_49_13]PIZ17980.1 MAG: diguanylate cyclase [Candidatus Desantisbacteria bacterium CG_4_10_14_0_8_um_filter_48_22]PJB28519.1 MAG: diguanylate cyclase [Candidatus Desantisbacteria bacterium CG_4_9_14_3_um_filter_50_7]
MWKYIARRLLLMIPVFLGITLVTFFIIHLAPGSPSDLLAEAGPRVSYEARARLEKLYGLDQPIHIQYLRWLKRFVVLDFGRSFRDERPVIDKILERLPATILLEGLSLLFIFLIAIPIGVLSAAKQYSAFDKSTTLLVFIGFSVPSFWLALMLMDVFGVRFNILPISGIRDIGSEYLPFWGRMLDTLKHLVLPVFVSAFTGLASVSRYTRAAMLEAIRQDYIRTARAKGLDENTVIYRHALRNAMLPVVTLIGFSIPGLIGGSFIIETIFAWPGMGRLGFNAIMARDYPVIMGVGVISAFLTLAGNLVADILYAVVDPRIRYR